MRAGFAEIDITPPVGTHKIGWLKDIISEQVRDPLYARAAVFEHADGRIAFVQLDTLSIRWSQVNDLRARIERQYGFPAACVMVSATHNHAGPAVANVGRVPRDEAYIEALMRNCVEVFGRALDSLTDAELGFNHVCNFTVANNRRVLMRDGTTRTHGTFADPAALCMEGPIDPEVAVLAAREPGGRLLGCLVNYACHPTHHGGETVLSAGYPGVLADEMRKQGCPTTLFLNGACGNIATPDPRTGKETSMEEAGRLLADDTRRAIAAMEFRSHWPLGARSTTLQLPYRSPTDDQVAGTARGAQRFIDPAIYDELMPALIERIKTRRTQPAEVQVLSAGDVAFASIPAEYFVEHGLRIKRESWPRHALVVSCANGMIGYVPTREAFEHGGYETTFAPSSRMAPETGDLLADAAIELIRQ